MVSRYQAEDSSRMLITSNWELLGLDSRLLGVISHLSDTGHFRDTHHLHFMWNAILHLKADMYTPMYKISDHPSASGYSPFFDTSKLKTEVPCNFVLDFSLGYGAFFTACQLVAYVMGRFYSDASRSVMEISDKGYRAALVRMVLGEVGSFVNDINLYFSFLLDFLYSDNHDFNKWWVDFESNFCSNTSRLSGGSSSVDEWSLKFILGLLLDLRKSDIFVKDLCMSYFKDRLTSEHLSGDMSVESVMDDLFSEFSGEDMVVRYGFNTEYFQKMFKLHQEDIRKIVSGVLIDEYNLSSSSGCMSGSVDVYEISDSEVTRR